MSPTSVAIRINWAHLEHILCPFGLIPQSESRVDNTQLCAIQKSGARRKGRLRLIFINHYENIVQLSNGANVGSCSYRVYDYASFIKFLYYSSFINLPLINDCGYLSHAFSMRERDYKTFSCLRNE